LTVYLNLLREGAAAGLISLIGGIVSCEKKEDAEVIEWSQLKSGWVTPAPSKAIRERAAFYYR